MEEGGLLLSRLKGYTYRLSNKLLQPYGHVSTKLTFNLNIWSCTL